MKTSLQESNHMNIYKKLIAFIAALTMSLTLVSSSAIADDSEEKTSLLQLALSVNTEGEFAGAFDTLVAAVLAADPAVVATLSGQGQHTVFAPTDDAFSHLGLDDTNIGDLPTELLTEILLYHVVHGRLDAADVISSNKLNTLLRGKKGFIMQDSGVLTDNLDRAANIIVTDLMAANGIIHAIDEVILPKAP